MCNFGIWDPSIGQWWGFMDLLSKTSIYMRLHQLKTISSRKTNHINIYLASVRHVISKWGGRCLAWYDASLGRWRPPVQIRPTPPVESKTLAYYMYIIAGVLLRNYSIFGNMLNFCEFPQNFSVNWDVSTMTWRLCKSY
jgi:hypothetical protein